MNIEERLEEKEKTKVKVKEYIDKYNKMMNLIPEDILDIINESTILSKSITSDIKKFIEKFKSLRFRGITFIKLEERKPEWIYGKDVSIKLGENLNKNIEDINSLITQIKSTNILGDIKLCHLNSTENH